MAFGDSPKLPAQSYGLRNGALSPVETLAQSISAVCPTLTPFFTVPLAFTLAGNAIWLAYVFATGGTLLVAWCISQFARYSASPGSLYSYVDTVLPPWLSTVMGWSLLLAYLGGSASAIGGFYYYTNVLLRSAAGREVSVLLLASMVTGVPVWLACRNVKISARVMLAIEATSVSAVCGVLALVLWRHGFHGDPDQLHLRGATPGGFRQGLVLAMYSFAGFDGATAMGAEARDPLKSIPRAVMQTAIFCGLFYTLCAYVEVLGLRMAGQDLATANLPMHVLARLGGIPALGIVTDVGALFALFAGTLACITAAARLLLMLAHKGLAHASMKATHPRHQTPSAAVMATGMAIFIPVIVLAAMGASGLDVYGWFGALGTYGFTVSYALVCYALPGYLRERHGQSTLATMTLPWLGFAAMIGVLLSNLYPVPEGVYGKLPYLFLAYLGTVLLLFAFRSRAKLPEPEQSGSGQ
jgi:amino acid transporter